MKTKKFWSMLLMMVVMLGTTLTFSSCKDDDEPGDALIGTWTNTEVEYGPYGDKYTTITDVTLMKGGMGVWSENWKSEMTIDGITNKYEGTDTDNFTWRVTGNLFYMIDNDGDISVCTFSIAGNKLTLIYGDEIEVFTRK